jgi:hypothetical protein
MVVPMDDDQIDALLSNPRYACLEMLARPEGVAITEICALSNWEKHTARSFLSRLG